jgi:hypothetical protein
VDPKLFVPYQKVSDLDQTLVIYSPSRTMVFKVFKDIFKHTGTK